MKLLPGLLAVCLLLTGCGGLPYPREMGDMALLRTMGVDREARGLTVTVSTGLRARGLQGETEEPLVLSAARPSLDGACLAMQGQSDSYVYFGYVDQLLLGEELARESVLPALDYFARDRELGLGARLWVVRGTRAETAVRAGEERGVDQRLETLRTDGEMGAALLSRTAGEVYADLLERGSAYVPALSPAGEGSAALEERGYAVLRGERLVGFLDGEAARGLELLVSQPELDVIEAELEENRAAVRVTGARTVCRLASGGEESVELSLVCRVSAQLSEYDRPLDAGERERVTAMLEARESARIQAALEQLQGWGTDCAGLGPRGALISPGLWQRTADRWPQAFAQAEVRVQVRVSLHT
ncbi:MAG: spore gernimation protein GerC [Lawsonibacter sp.]|nr:spore gernimation protein GerC [Lawsonibacter sp.]